MWVETILVGGDCLNNQDYVLVETEYVGLYMWVETVNGWDYMCGWRLY